MKQKLSVIGKIEPPFTDVDYREIDVLCEKLIETCQQMQNRTASVYAKNTASDIIDVLVDIKVDVQEYGTSVNGGSIFPITLNFCFISHSSITLFN